MSDYEPMKLLLFLLAMLPSIAFGQSPPQPGFFSAVQMLWFDSEFNADAELAPRVVFGFDDVVGWRARYWSYDHAASMNHPIVGNSWGFDRTVRLDFDVIDLEAMTHVRHEHSDLLLSGGARIAHIDYNFFQLNRGLANGNYEENTWNSWQKNDPCGVTFAAEGRTLVVTNFSAIYGGRVSALKNFFVPEGFAGVEVQLGRAFTRLSVEIQEWDQRTRTGINGAGQNNFGDGQNYGFTGYGFDLGWTY